MKGKKFVLLLLVTVSIFACLAFVACNNTDESTHEHTYSSAWTSDENYHWHVATCGHDVISGKAEHIWDGGVVTKEPTCTEKGEKTYTCTVCDKTKKEEIAASGHTFSEAWESNETHHWHICLKDNCDEVSDKAEHVWDGGVVTKEPTCTEKGEKTYTCTVCDKTKKEEIAASGHTFSNEWESNETHHWHICLKDNCDEVSDKAAHTGNPCTVCGYENIPEHEHSLEYHAAKPVTCTENGNIEYWECTGCHKYFADEQGETEITDKNSVIIVTEGHKWGEWETVKQATCTEEGKKERQCSACTEKENEPIPALNHSYGEWQTIKEPTCTEEGEKQRVCSRCSHSETETLPVIAHTYDGYIKNSEYHWQKCSVCQNESEREPHNFVEGICSVCNYDSRYSWELDFTLTGDYYTVTGIGDCTDKEIKIPESYEGKPVKAIAANAFWGQTGITSFNIPKSIESIGNNAFQNCTGLEKISIENKNIELGTGAFLGCEKISWASCPAFVVSEIAVTNLKILFVTDGELENAVLTDAKNLVSLTVPDITTTLGAVFGANTDVLESLTLTETTEIAEYAFKDFTALKEINLPEGINSIGADAFLNTAYYNDASNWVFNVLYVDSYLLKANTQISGHYPINNNTTVIADAAFSSCNGLTSIVISDNVKTIGNNAFENCSGLMSITIPASVTSIGEGAFSGCSNLIKIETDAENPNYFSQDGILYSRKNTGFVHIPAKLQGNIVIADGIVSIFDNAFSGRSGLSSVIIPDSVTSIGSGAFEGCGGLTNVSIPDSVTCIGSSAFEGCSGLTSITIPFVGENIEGNGATRFGYIFGTVPKSLKEVIIAGGTSIGEQAFYGCSGLTSVIIPNSVTSIGSSAFSGCSGLTSITIPDSVTSIENSAFYGCSGLTSITIPNSVTSIGDYAFSGCSGLTSITIPESVKSIGWGAFYGCSGLSSVIIPDSVTSIGRSAFSGCSGLKSITIGNSVTSIGSYAFRGCSGLTSITIPASVTSIGEGAFSGCSNLIKIETDSENPNYFSQDGILYSRKNTGFVHIPAKLQGNIVIADGIVSIFDNAFSDRSGLSSVIIPDSVTSIGSGAFEGCSGLTSITIPFVGGKADGSGKTHFGYIFGARSDSYNDDYVPENLKEVIITGGTSIGSDAFRGCSGLTSITIPNSVTSIGEWAFYGCSGLTSITIPNSVTSIGSDAFRGCSGLTSITIPNSVTSIGSYAFDGCSGLASITIPNSVTSIGEWAFYGCSGLTSITIPFVGAKADGSGATHFGYVFGASSYGSNDYYVPKSLKEVIITGGTSIGSYAFEGCSGLTSITIPNSVTSIGSSAFRDCSGLTSVTIPDSVISIKNGAFSGVVRLNIYYAGNIASWCGISGLDNLMSSNRTLYIDGQKMAGELIIPDGVTSIGDSAFEGCSELTSIIIPNSVTSIGSYAFYNCSGLTSITIPFVGAKADGSGKTHFGYIFGASSDSYNDDYVPENLKEVIITGGTSIRSYAFRYCSGLTSITIPNSVTSIGSDAFGGCSGLTSITIPDSVTSIGRSAFRYCSGLTSITIPNSVTSIGSYAFYGCSGLTSVTIPESITSIGDSTFLGCSGLTSITIPESVKSIGWGAFYGCGGLTSITIPNSVTSIGDSAFSYCSKLTNVTIPDSVTSIGDSAFSGCSRLTIYCESESKPSGWYGDWNPDNRPVIWGYKNQ